MTGRIQEGAAGADATAALPITEPLPSVPDHAARLASAASSVPGRAVRPVQASTLHAALAQLPSSSTSRRPPPPRVAG